MRVRKSGQSKNQRNIRNNENLARRIPRTSGFTTRGYFPSRKSLSVQYFESHLELYQLIEAEFDPTVRYINTQPHTIGYLNHQGRFLQYTPDVMLLMADGCYRFREVKPEKLLNHLKFDRLSSVYDGLSVEFDIFTDKQFSKTRHTNLRRLFHLCSRYFDNDELLFNILKALPHQCTIEEAQNILRQKHIWAAGVFYCLFLQYYLCDLEVPMSPNTIITCNIV